MMSFLSLILSFFLLSFSRQILVNLFWKIAKPNFAKTIYFLLLFPGVIIHELSHFVLACLLFVPTGEITIFPEGKKLGSVQIAKTDPIRQSIIGLAPTIIGTATILSIFLVPLNLPPKIIGILDLLVLIRNKKNLFWLYLVFAINNTMFASESDRRSWLGSLALVILIGSSLYLFGLFSLIAWPLIYYATIAANLVTSAYTSTLLVNLVFIIPLFICQKIIEKLK